MPLFAFIFLKLLPASFLYFTTSLCFTQYDFYNKKDKKVINKLDRFLVVVLSFVLLHFPKDEADYVAQDSIWVGVQNFPLLSLDLLKSYEV